MNASRKRRGASAAVILFASLAACSQAAPTFLCNSSADCLPSEACVSGACTSAVGHVLAVQVTAEGATTNPPTLLVGAKQQFTAVVTGVDKPEVVWAVEPVGGTIDKNGLFTAFHPGTWHVKAVSAADVSKSGSAVVIVSEVTIQQAQPASANLPTGGQQRFTVIVGNSLNQRVVWDVVEPDGGSISADGLYQAPTPSQLPATFHVRATSVVDPTQTSIATVTVHSLDIAISPSSAVVQVGGQQTFTTASQPVFWFLEEPSLGDITKDGVLTVNSGISTPNTIHVIGASLDPFSNRSAVVEVTIPEVSIAVSPVDAAVRFGGAVQFSAVVANSVDQRVSWIVNPVDGQAVSSTGLYTAPAGTGTGTGSVLAQPVADPSKSVNMIIHLDERPSIKSFASVQGVIPPGAPATLSWSVVGGQSLGIDSGVGDVTGQTSIVVRPQATTTYTLSATNTLATVNASVTVQVEAGVPVISAFSSSPGRALPGAKSTLSWSVSGADTVDIEPGIGTVPAVSTVQVAPGAETEYTLTASNAHGQSTAKTLVMLARFRPTAPLSVPRQTGDQLSSQSRTIFQLADGTSLLIGGMRMTFSIFTFVPEAELSAEIFDPAAADGEGAFVSVVPFAADDINHFAAVQLPSGTVFAGSGILERYDPVTASFEMTIPRSVGTGNFGAVLHDGRIFLVGSFGQAIYDPVLNEWIDVPFPDGPPGHFGEPITLPSGKVLLPGLDQPTYLFDPAAPSGTDPFTPSNAIFFDARPDGFEGAFVLPDGKVFIAPNVLYDPVTDSFLPDIPLPPDFHYWGDPAVMLPNGSVLLLGERDNRQMTSLLYDPSAANGAGAVFRGPEPHSPHATGFVGLISDHAILFAGGSLEGNSVGTQQSAEIFEWQ